MPDHIARFANLGIDLATSTPEERNTPVKSDTDRFAKLCDQGAQISTSQWHGI